MPFDRKLFLLDAMALIYQAFYAYRDRPLINSKGVNTSAVHGFANVLYKLLKEEKPTHLGVAFDTMAPTLRHEDFIDYKANRQEMPEDLSASLPHIRKLVECFNIPVLFAEGYEADDVIGTLARKAEDHGFKVFMVTPDKDFGQLVTDNIFIYKPGRFGDKPSVMGPAEVCARFGIKKPEQVIDMLGIWGDSSDNIPGIPGIGEVGARKLLEQFGNLENILQNIDKITPEGIRQKVISGRESAIQSKSLATIILNAPVEFEEDRLKVKDPDEPRLKELLEELEMRTFAKRVFTDLLLQKQSKADASLPDLFGGTVSEPEKSNGLKNIHNTAHNYTLCNTDQLRQQAVHALSRSLLYSFDTETTGPDPNTAELVGISFSIQPGSAWYIPLPRNYEDCCRTLGEFREVLENESTIKAGQNLKFDISMLAWYGITVRGPLFDTMLAHYLIEPDLRHNMDYLARTYLNYAPVPIEQLIGKKGRNQLSMDMIPEEEVKEYAAEDADITLQLYHILNPLLDENGQKNLFNTVEIPLVPVLSSMETEGVKLDKKALNDYSSGLHSEILKLEDEIYSLAGLQFNISSPKQLGEVIFGQMKIADNTKKTATRQLSTAEDVLVKLENKHPIVRKILDYRSLTKLKSTYVDVLPELINPRTGRIHTSFNQAVAATGRLSSNNPNLQNIPVRTEKGREIRKAFVPRNIDFELVSADYSQIELRIIAALSHEQGMIEDFRKGLDIHSTTASRVYNIPLEEVTREMRRNAKMVNFGIIYGISAFGLAERLNIPRREAAEIIDQYFQKYPAIRRYMEETIDKARKLGYVETILGRRRYLRDINSSNAVVRGYAERNAINAPIQGSAADMIKIAMIRIHNRIRESAMRSRMILQVHDELVFDVFIPEKEFLIPVIREEMMHAVDLTVPMEVEISAGKNWLEAH